jgi:phospholipid/cholesterol/gamma-HCH transport system substrate-binding protein
MKHNVSSKIRLGIFVTIGLAVLIAAVYFIGEKQQMFRSTFRLSAVFKDVSGLQAGNNVRLAGINVGIVENISLISDTTVRVIIIIDNNAREFIKKDAIGSIGSEGLMGNKTLIISPGTGGNEQIEDNDVIATSPPIDMDDVLFSLKSTLDNTQSITNDLAVISNNIQSGQGTIGRLIMDKSWRENFDSTFANLKEGSDGFKIFMKKANDLDEILASLKTTIENTASVTDDLAKITSNIESGDGIIGRLLMDKSWGETFDSTFSNLQHSSKSFNQLLDKAKDSWLLWGF